MSLPDISNEKLNKTVAESLHKVFATMLSFNCATLDSEDLSGTKPPFPDFSDADMSGIYVGSVGLVGSVHGLVYLYLKSRLAEAAARKMTSLDGAHLDFEIVSDVCGELTNMFGGTFKNTLADLGYRSALTIPTVLSGDELFISTMGVKKHLRQRFSCEGDQIVADLVLAEPPVG